MKTTGIIVAAGESERFDGEDKLFADLLDRPVLQYSVELLDRVTTIEDIVLVCHPDNRSRFEDLVEQVNPAPSTRVVPGGDTRHESVQKGLDAPDNLMETVMIHDGARPGAGDELCDRLLDHYSNNKDVKCFIPVIKIPDTVKEINPESRLVNRTLDRSILRRVQTPQLFDTDVLLKSIDSWTRDRTPTDEARVLEAAGRTVGTVTGTVRCRKITTRDDLRVLEAILGTKPDG